LSKGSFDTSDNGSAHTHDGGGVVDINTDGWGATRRGQTVRALRTVGFAAWVRTPDDDPDFEVHIHAVAVADPSMHIQAANQVADYYGGRNALASHRLDRTPSTYRAPFTWWERYRGL
jgi:hypothetical protein